MRTATAKMPITVLQSPPTPITPVEHAQLTSSTPSSFSDIPPVCHRKVDGVKLRLAPGLDGWTVEGEVEGTLYVSSECVQHDFLTAYA